MEVDRETLLLMSQNNKEIAVVTERVTAFMDKMDDFMDRTEKCLQRHETDIGMLKEYRSEQVGITKGQAVLGSLVIVMISTVISLLAEYWFKQGMS